MSRILYIQASPRKERSKSIQVADAFVKSYLKSHPADTVAKLNLFEADLPSFDGLAVQAKYTILHGQSHTAQERQVWDKVEKVIEHFKNADKYVFAVPMWNFGIPWRLKQYIDILVQPGYTFRFGQNGYEGLVRGKPAMVIYSRGGSYPADSPFDLQKKYFELILGFIGFEQIGSILAEPTLADPSESEKAVQRALEQARKAAETF
ncbi:MAG TPA: NAD(P)H-dependent oxidoreductase [Anaerohalosphaeraceae bacterium]|nr:NAD(P)H-dependent oxidoreductase [Anaerohalosphaeraceae bacterium]HOL89213.1 NAD(P)H-dependent oxidoreductase [Anaerohalosphaeraceae bacterium]HPP56299.1 NAD(P)H-dependent oxidoreductase [Anaerohalosphaeraceae bacterium]